ncbi:spr1629 family repressor/antitoxin [Cytobacillus purgationiresistens]|uniref:Zn-dependent peptidase ImmA (M78 family)/DNA-binding XRE family transcriptional regulator n=1 Tax=Cytobacillus purgationiresistens TaxID=863449 RepID=A0ABU0AQ42_9BACI|nr:XRE family transcriptional regulator [Cytobacillus purgationiresistens]MDQ0273340.1 Zn-dependent peptidase ImmA (M78 family)/DNA-binding XRE family transcriptional regulator [Cytobacillus purgationiresistens]
MFIGKSLTNIRILNELSRSQLAEELGITEQAVWQYENGYVSPKLEVVNKMKTLFKVKSAYFFREDLLENSQPENIRIERIAYRSESINSAMKTQSELVHVKFLDAFIKKIGKKIKYPKNEILSLRQQVLEYLNSNQDIERELQIRYIAQLARKHINLSDDNNKNFLFHLEKSGVFIFEKSIGETIDAYSLWSEDDIPYIVLGNMKKSAARRNFDLAHELGHLLLHYKTEFNMLDNSSYKIKEDEAHLFASEFLMPMKAFTEDVSKINKVSNPDAYRELKEKWLVSLQSMAMRARNLELITHQQFRYFFMSINKNGYRKEEPLDAVLPIEKPMKVRSILQLILEKKIIDLEQLTEELKVDIKFLASITGIEEEFFAKYLDNNQQSFSINDLKIIN